MRFRPFLPALALLLGLALAPEARAQFVQYSFTGAAGNEDTFPAGRAARRGLGLAHEARHRPDALGRRRTRFRRATSPSPPRATRLLTSAFTVTPDAGQAFTFTRLLFDERRSGTGPRTWAVYSSRDGFAAPLATGDVPDDTNTRPDNPVTLGAAFANVRTPVTFRFYAYSAEAAGGTWRLDNVRLEAGTAVSGPSVRFGTAPTSVSEAAGSARLVLALTEPSATEATTVRLRVTGGTATRGQDYRVADTVLTVPAGASSLDVAFPILNDATAEPNETVILALETPSRGVLASPSTFTLTIVDDDQPVTVHFASAEAVVFEGDGAVSIPLLLDGPAPSAAASITLTRLGGTATPGSDYSLPPAPILFDADQHVAYANVTLYQDLVDEGDETAVFGLTINSGDPKLTVGTPGTLTLRIREQKAALGGTVCPDLAGTPLLNCLRQNYSRTTVVGYDAARDFLYGSYYPGPPYTGVYSGRAAPLGGGGSTVQIDTEHTWPRSTMADVTAQEGDMHNLFPTISKVNNDRGNLPFGEIADTLATGWYCPTGTLPQSTPIRRARRLLGDPARRALRAARGPQGQRGPRDGLLRDDVHADGHERGLLPRGPPDPRGLEPPRPAGRGRAVPQRFHQDEAGQRQPLHPRHHARAPRLRDHRRRRNA